MSEGWLREMQQKQIHFKSKKSCPIFTGGPKKKIRFIALVIYNKHQCSVILDVL